VSFNVPRYFPQLAIDSKGKVAFDHRAEAPVAGPGFSPTLPPDPPNPYVVDGGSWDGRGFRSSGLSPNNESDLIVGFRIRFAKAGTYQYACLIHPGMVGKVVVAAA
jgi:hypothetical protein